MNSFDADPRRQAPKVPLLTAVAEWHVPLPVPANPIESWLDLMEVIEALCPEWPARATAAPSDYRL